MKKISETDLFNLWLIPYHNTTIESVIINQPKEVLQNPSWFELYPVTEEQYDEWTIKAKELIRKSTKMSKKYVDRHFGFIALMCGPYVKKE